MSKIGKRKPVTQPYGALILGALLVGAGPAATTFTVDPYEFFRSGQHDKRRNETSEKAHYPLWKFTHYHREAELVVLGDSRARALRDKYWSEYDSAPAYNFAYGGGTIPEIHSTFQAIKDDPKLKTLVVGIQLRSFDESHKDGLNRVPEARKATAGPVSHLKNWFVARRSWRIFKEDNPGLVRWVKNILPEIVSKASATDLGRPGKTRVETLLLPDVCFGCDLPPASEIVEPPVSKGPNLGLGRHNAELLTASLQPLPDKFERQVRKNASSDWKSFRFSERYFQMIEEISRWADARSDRNLIFFIPPTIVEMQSTIAAHGLGSLNLSFRRRLSALAPIVDFDFPSSLTRDIDNFSDAYHFQSTVARRLVGEIITVRGATEGQRKRISKRRSIPACPSLSGDAGPLMGTDFLEGNACRVWGRRENG